MKRRNQPAFVLAKLSELEEVLQGLTERIAKTEDGIAAARKRLTGTFAQKGEYEDMRATLNQMIADKPILEQKLGAAKSTLSACKAWLNHLPEETVLEQVAVEAKGSNLVDVRARIKTRQAELTMLRAVPIASPDIKQRVEQYVNTLGRPKVAGISQGETLRVTWPGDGQVLPMMLAFFQRDAMVDALMREIESVANDPVPLVERKKRIAELEVDIEVLQRQALVLGASTTDLPPHVVLKVKVREHALSERKRLQQREHAA